jgi:hypothetical protein
MQLFQNRLLHYYLIAINHTLTFVIPGLTRDLLHFRELSSYVLSTFSKPFIPLFNGFNTINLFNKKRSNKVFKKLHGSSSINSNKGKIKSALQA